MEILRWVLNSAISGSLFVKPQIFQVPFFRFSLIVVRLLRRVVFRCDQSIVSPCIFLSNSLSTAGLLSQSQPHQSPVGQHYLFPPPTNEDEGLGFGWVFFFFCVQCHDRAKSSGRWLLGSPPSAVVPQHAPRAWCPLQCLLAKTVDVLSPGVGRSEECAQVFGTQSRIHSGLNQQDLVSSDVFLAHSDQYTVGRW